MKLCSVVLCVLLSASVACAMDLAEMQKMALENRQVIKQYITNLEQGEKNLTLAEGAYYPSADLYYNVNSLDEHSLIERKENSTAVASISWNIFSGFRDKYSVKSAELLKEVDTHKLKGVKQDIMLRVALAFLGVYERRANRNVAESAFQTLEKVYRDGESRYQVGLIGKNELLKFRVDYDNADITLKAAEAGLKKSVHQLSRQVGAELIFEELDFEDFKTLPSEINEDEYTEKMLTGRSEIKALQSVIASTSARADAEQADYYPRVDVIGSYTKYDDDYITGHGSLEEDELRGRLVMSMNLFKGFTTEAKVAKTRLQSRSLGYELDELKNTLGTDLKDLFIDFQVALQNVGVANRSIEQAQENLRITQLKYDEGLQRESDLLDAITSLSRAKYNYVAVIRTLFANDFQLTRMIEAF